MTDRVEVLETWHQLHDSHVKAGSDRNIAVAAANQAAITQANGIDGLPVPNNKTELLEEWHRTHDYWSDTGLELSEAISRADAAARLVWIRQNKMAYRASRLGSIFNATGFVTKNIVHNSLELVRDYAPEISATALVALSTVGTGTLVYHEAYKSGSAELVKCEAKPDETVDDCEYNVDPGASSAFAAGFSVVVAGSLSLGGAMAYFNGRGKK